MSTIKASIVSRVSALAIGALSVTAATGCSASAEDGAASTDDGASHEVKAADAKYFEYNCALSTIVDQQLADTLNVKKQGLYVWYGPSELGPMFPGVPPESKVRFGFYSGNLNTHIVSRSGFDIVADTVDFHETNKLVYRVSVKGTKATIDHHGDKGKLTRVAEYACVMGRSG